MTSYDGGPEPTGDALVTEVSGHAGQLDEPEAQDVTAQDIRAEDSAEDAEDDADIEAGIEAEAAHADGSEDDASDEEDAEDAHDDADAEDAPAEESDEELDPVEEMRSALQRAPGEWYVVHSYAGYENKVKS
ncbi:MAG TPA: transcription termination/antitermination protein NusG, partial [Pseudonocardia sp.]|nr:transcription termination/antitermination protein NusG [Pseudonocardia sp.]